MRQKRLWILIGGVLTGCAWLLVISTVMEPFDVSRHEISITIEHSNIMDDYLDVKEQAGEDQDEQDPPIRVALYKGFGASPRSWMNLRRILQCHNRTIKVVPLKNMNMERINRNNFDVMVIPGGQAGNMFNWHTEHGSSLRKTTRTFLRQGGGYVGFCAGAYLGRGFFQVSPFHKASTMLGVGQFTNVKLGDAMEYAPYPISAINEKNLYYANGPIFKDLKSYDPETLPKEIKNPKVLLRLEKKTGTLEIKHRTEIQPKLYTTKDYAGFPLIVANEFSKGKVVLSTGHPESDITGGFKLKEVVPTECHSAHANMILNMIYYAANRTNFEAPL